MHAWGAMGLRNYLAKKNHGYSISAQSYEFCPHLIQLDILDFILSLYIEPLRAFHIVLTWQGIVHGVKNNCVPLNQSISNGTTCIHEL